MPLPRTVDYPHIPRFPGAPLFPVVAAVTVAVDGAIPIDVDASYYLTKGSAGANSVAAPGAANIGREIEILGGSDFAHVITFTGATLHDGTTGGHATVTLAAFQGSSVRVKAVTAAKWNVLRNNLAVITT